MDDGLDKNSQVCSSFSRFVPLQAHPKTSRTRIIQGDFEGELLTCFQGECIAVGFSFLLGSAHEKKGKGKKPINSYPLSWPNTDAFGKTGGLQL